MFYYSVDKTVKTIIRHKEMTAPIAATLGACFGIANIKIIHTMPIPNVTTIVYSKVCVNPSLFLLVKTGTTSK